MTIRALGRFASSALRMVFATSSESPPSALPTGPSYTLAMVSASLPLKYAYGLSTSIESIDAVAACANSVRIKPGSMSTMSTPKPCTSKRIASEIASSAYFVAW